MVKAESTFTDINIGGYTVSGTVYTSQLCFITNECKWVYVYGGSQISADNWLLNQDATYGIIGMGPNSPLWSGYIGQDSIAVYSIAIARTQGLTDARGNTVNSVVSTNITLGAANSTAYTGTPLSITANSDNTYNLS